MGALVLDLLLIIIFLMMVPIGFYRGGLRELCTSAGLLLGILLAQSWADRWSALPKSIFEIGDGAATFLMGVLIAFGVAALIGYGGSAAFTYQPGPGGRLYGAYLALINAMVGAGFLINLYLGTIVPTSSEEAITTGFVSRALSNGFGWVLLVAAIGAGVATIFGMFVRERPEAGSGYQPTVPLYQGSIGTRPYRVEDEPAPVRSHSEPVRITEVATDAAPEVPDRPDPTRYGSGWRQTWPDSRPDTRTRPESKTEQRSTTSTTQENRPTATTKRVLANWVKDQES